MPPLNSTPSRSAAIRRSGAGLAWIGRLFLTVLASVTLIVLLRNLWHDPQLFIQIVLSGLQLGFVYALIALGYTMVYGIVRLINFAHGGRVHGRGICELLRGGALPAPRVARDRLPRSAPAPGRCHWLHDRHASLHDRLHAAGNHHRAGCLQASARRAAHCRPHHRHRRLLLPGILRGAQLRLFTPLHPLPAPLRRGDLVHQGWRPPGERYAGPPPTGVSLSRTSSSSWCWLRS